MIRLDTRIKIRMAGVRYLMQEIRTEFEQISNMPIVAVIYTHGHPDHILGTSVFLEKAAEEVEILSHAGTIDFLIEQFGLLQQILNARGMRQFGTYLPEEYASVLGLGPLLRFDHEKLPTFIFPTKVFGRELTLEIGGEKLVLLYAPGETEDQIVIWMPEKKCSLPATTITLPSPTCTRFAVPLPAPSTSG
ncbi:MAG: MBL fold metallo-hydrolase [Dethiobacteria bacterium]